MINIPELSMDKLTAVPSGGNVAEKATDALNERRIKVRHSAPSLGVTIRQDGWLHLFDRASPAVCIDINRYGVGLECEVPFRKGDSVVLDFRGMYIKRSNVKAVIVSVRKMENAYRYGLIFRYCISAHYYSREEDNALSYIENVYSREKQYLELNGKHTRTRRF